MIKKIKYYWFRIIPEFKTIAIQKGLLAGNRNYRKFILLGNARTGSTLLQSYLNEHSEIFCEGEIFNTNHLKIYGKPKKLRRKMLENPLKYLRTYGYPLHSSKIKVAGFKLFYSHFRTSETKIIWDFLKEKKDIKIIHIKRKNFLKSFVSLKIATKTNEWRAFNSNISTENKSISLTKQECIDEFELQNKLYSEMENIFEKHELLEVFYDDLTENPQETMNKVFDFLETQRISISKPALIKQNPEMLNQLITNYESLKQDFKNTEWEHFFD